MSDSYQAIYEATRSRIRPVDSQLVVDAIKQAFDISYVAVRMVEAIDIARYEMTRPSVLFRPNLSLDGNKWCALLGENLQEGCAGFGDSPSLAMEDFDKQFAKINVKDGVSNE